MAEDYVVNIKLSPGKKVRIEPERIKVPQYSIIQWNIIYIKPYRWDFKLLRRGLTYSVYLNEGSPFSWTTESLHLIGKPSLLPLSPLKFKLAEGRAINKGDFKYGIKILVTESDEVLFDEDPYIQVF